MDNKTMKRMTAKEFRDLVGADKKQGTNKYHAQKVGGHASLKEHKHAGELKLLESVGAIYDLKEQVPFVLIPAQRDENGNLLERAVTYKADFVYRDRKGNLIVEDTKGYRTKEYIIKRKLMLHIHGIRIKEI